MKLGIDVNRHKEIIVKAISALLLLLLKHFKLNHIYQVRNSLSLPISHPLFISLSLKIPLSQSFLFSGSFIYLFFLSAPMANRSCALLIGTQSSWHLALAVTEESEREINVYRLLWWRAHFSYSSVRGFRSYFQEAYMSPVTHWLQQRRLYAAFFTWPDRAVRPY